MIRFSFFILMGLLGTTDASASEPKPPTLAAVMVTLADSMSQLGQGIYFEKYSLIARSAHKVAHHPKPLGQLPLIAKMLGNRMPQFKKIDLQVHQAAIAIVAQAKKRDMAGIVRNHSVIVKSCVQCHTTFRAEVTGFFQ